MFIWLLTISPNVSNLLHSSQCSHSGHLKPGYLLIEFVYPSLQGLYFVLKLCMQLLGMEEKIKGDLAETCINKCLLMSMGGRATMSSVKTHAERGPTLALVKILPSSAPVSFILTVRHICCCSASICCFSLSKCCCESLFLS